MKTKILLFLIGLCLLKMAPHNPLMAQSNFSIHLKGLQLNDTLTIIVQKSSDKFYKQQTVGDGSGANHFNFELEDGKWSINIDTKGYTFPASTVFEVPDKKSASITLTPLLNKDYSYTWEDDDSFVGHATQTYVNEKSKIKFLETEIKVPNDYSSIKLRNKYGIILSNEKEVWTIEDSYRLYKMFTALPFDPYSEGTIVDPESGKNIRGVFELTKEEQHRDLSISDENGIKKGIVSQSAFGYSNPQIVTIDGIKGKFYSKRLYHAVVNFITEFGVNDEKVDWIAKEKFGFRFMKSDQETEELMNEDASNFQEFFSEEKIEILSMFEELPEGLQKQKGLQYLVRRINGQENPKYPKFAAIAWTGNHTIEFMESAFKSSDLSSMRRLILHEKTHFLWEYTFDENLKKDWAEVGGWFEDPTSPSGWTTYNTTAFVSPYGHDNNPNEDMAESMAYYLENPDKLKSVSMEKYEFIRDRIMHGTKYIAQIREDLTFTVYNLFPDYTFPGKVTKVEVDALGKPEEDKEVTIKATLHSENVQLDGATGGYIRFISILGTIHDIRLYPENGSVDSVLIGKTSFSKYEKSGYWTMTSFRVWDAVGNQRYESVATIGMKLFIENPMEDPRPPKWNNDLKLELIEGKFSGDFNVKPSDTGEQMQALKVSYSYYDDIPLNRSLSRVIIATADNEDFETYSKDIQSNQPFNEKHELENGMKSNKYFEMYLGIRDYLQPGYYTVSYSIASDIGKNESQVFFVNDTADFHINPDSEHLLFKDKRDSIYVKTKYPDYLKPEIDINRISIKAEPINPTAPDGETRVDISLPARDFSDYEGKESGVYKVSFVLRDPMGNEHGYQTGNSTMNHPQLLADAKPDNNSEWRNYDFNFLLPKGSAPGKWGISSATIMDRAGNIKRYSFVEYVRFDVIESDVQLEEELQASINSKFVNAENVNNIDVEISCKPGDGLNYNYTIYSLAGGKVVKGSGVMEGDQMTLKGIDTEGVLDGVLKLCVQMTDAEGELVATKTVEYDKDTQRPKAYYTRTNLQNDGESNLDDLVLEMVFEESEVGSTYELYLEDVTYSVSSNHTNSTSLSDLIKTEVIPLEDLKILDGTDKVIKTQLRVTDQFDNVGDRKYNYFLFADNQLTPVDEKTDSDGDGIVDIRDDKPNESNSDQVLPNIHLDLYPIPAVHKISIETEGAGILRIYNLNSKLVFQKEVTSQIEEVDVSGFDSGFYVIKYEYSRSVQSMKFIKN